jgi:NADP-reducing hydrogenase subunit HndD
MVEITINGKKIQAEDGATILEAAKAHNIRIPSLCYMKNVHKLGSCRICVVEVEGAKGLQASCITPVAAGMVIRTNSPRVRRARKVIYELILSDHPRNCLNCGRNQQCELQDLGVLMQIDSSRFEGAKSKDFIDDSSPAVVRDATKCVLCRRCVTVCNDVQGVGVLNAQDRGFGTTISPGEDLLLGTAACTNCGQCTVVCPVNALKEQDGIQDVWKALGDPGKTVVVQTAPAIRAALGEEFGLPVGTLVTGKMASALREIGFKHVFDTNFTADLTIMEEGYELLGRIASHMKALGKVDEAGIRKLGLPERLPEPVLPMITSCSPGWIKYVEHYYGGLLAHLSSCKSPHTMLGALVKSFFAEKQGIDPGSLYVVSIMPCTAKKYEITRPEMQNGGLPNVDAVLTTRELARMIKEAGIDFLSLPEGKFDSPMGISTGAADIFGTTGGVMEAALRTVYEVVTGRELPFGGLHVQPIQGFERIKSAAITLEDCKPEWFFLNGVSVGVAVTSGLKGASQLMEEVKEGRSPYLFIEVMGCPGGCISGGGQPRSDDPDFRTKRMKAIYAEDEGKELRKSHENPDVLKLYEEFLGSPNGHRSHELLHTTYTNRGKF